LFCLFFFSLNNPQQNHENYDVLIPVLVNAFQAQQQEIELLKAKN
jgi:hypothetical protein